MWLEKQRELPQTASKKLRKRNTEVQAPERVDVLYEGRTCVQVGQLRCCPSHGCWRKCTNTISYEQSDEGFACRGLGESRNNGKRIDQEDEVVVVDK